MRFLSRRLIHASAGTDVAAALGGLRELRGADRRGRDADCDARFLVREIMIA